MVLVHAIAGMLMTVLTASGKHDADDDADEDNVNDERDLGEGSVGDDDRDTG